MPTQNLFECLMSIIIIEAKRQTRHRTNKFSPTIIHSLNNLITVHNIHVYGVLVDELPSLYFVSIATLFFFVHPLNADYFEDLERRRFSLSNEIPFAKCLMERRKKMNCFCFIIMMGV